MPSPDCDCPGGQEYCQLNEPCEPCKQEILERGIESAQLQAELEAELEAELDESRRTLEAERHAKQEADDLH